MKPSPLTFFGILAKTEYYQPSEIAVLVVKGWMDSPGHRASILTLSWNVEGIGVAISADDYVYITEDFS